MVIQAKSITAEELLRDYSERCCELIDGEIHMMIPAGGRHGRIAMVIGRMLDQHVFEKKLGIVLGAETGFILRRQPDTVRAPDAAFIRSEKLPAGPLPDAYLDIAPDLVVEVVSPTDSPADVHAKAGIWIEFGVKYAWVIWPVTRKVTVYRPDQSPTTLSAGDPLKAEDIPPRFQCTVSQILEV